MYAECLGEPVDIEERDVPFAAFNGANVCAMEPWVSTQMGHKDLAVTLTVYAKCIPNNRPNPLNGRQGAVARLRAV